MPDKSDYQVGGLTSVLREFPLQKLMEQTPSCQDSLLDAVSVDPRDLDLRRIVLNQGLLLRR